MKKSILNGTPVPYGLPVDALEDMMSAPDMKTFSLACEALSYKDDPAAFRVMKAHLDDRDKYRRLYVLKTIFRHPEAAALTDRLEAAITSDDPLFVSAGLNVISDFRIRVSDDLLLSVVDRALPRLYTELEALRTPDVSDDHYARLVGLFRRVDGCAQKEILGRILTDAYLPDKAEALFDLFRSDGFAKIRLMAVDVGRRSGYDLAAFLSDMDGHVRKRAASSLGRLSFLAKYLPALRVDVSVDLRSAVIYNPAGHEHLYIYDDGDEYEPFTLCFSYQHVHAADADDAAAWIDDILNERVLAVEFFRGQERLFGGQIDRSDLSRLSYEFLTRAFGGELPGCPGAADSIRVRGWTGRHDLNGRILSEDGRCSLELVPARQS